MTKVYKRASPKLSVWCRFPKNSTPRLTIYFNAAMVDYMGWEADERVAIIVNDARSECRLRLTPVGADRLSDSSGNLKIEARINLIPRAIAPQKEFVDFTISPEGDILFPLPRWAWRASPKVPAHAGPVIPFGAKRKAMLDAYDRRPVE